MFVAKDQQQKICFALFQVILIQYKRRSVSIFEELLLLTIFLFIQLDALKRTVDRTNQDLESTRTQVSQLKKDIIDKQGRLREMVEIRETLNEKLKVATEAQLSAEELATRMDELMEAEEKRQKVCSHFPSYIVHPLIAE